jgi:hypothetical protein
MADRDTKPENGPNDDFPVWIVNPETFDLEVVPMVKALEWGLAHGGGPSMQLETTEVDGLTVSTVFIMDQFRRGRPCRSFETATITAAGDLTVRDRYGSHAEALVGHDMWVARLANAPAPR